MRQVSGRNRPTALLSSWFATNLLAVLFALFLLSFACLSADKILIIDDVNLMLSEKIDRSVVQHEISQAEEVNTQVDNDADYLEQFSVVIYAKTSWDNTFHASTKSAIEEYAEGNPTVVYADENATVNLPLFDITYDGANKTVMLPDISLPPNMETSYVTIKRTEDDILNNVLIPKGLEIAFSFVPGSDSILIPRAFVEDGVVWGLVSVLNSASQKVFIISLPFCLGTGVACTVTAAAGSIYLTTTAADTLKDIYTIERVITPTSTFDVEEGTFSHSAVGVTIEDVRCECDSELRYAVLKPKLGTIIYSNEYFKVIASTDTHLAIDNDSVCGKGLCCYPCGTATDSVFFAIKEGRVELEDADGELVLHNNLNRVYTFDQPQLVTLTESGMHGEGLLRPQGNETSFMYDNDGDVYATQPVVLYGSVQPASVPAGKESTISVTVTNLGPETIQSLWLGLDIHDPAGNKTENTKTPIADDPTPFGTGEIGWIDFSSQGSSLKPGESRTFMATYSFRKSVIGHQYHAGAYTYRFRVWANGYPGQEGAIPVGPLQSEILRVTDGSAEATSSTVLVIDTSGSMKGEDRTGKTKIDAAREAAIDLVNMLRSGSSSTSSHEVAVVAFSTSARTVIPMTSDYDAAIAEINTMSADGNTNVHQGMVLANGQLQNAAGKPIIILLSDGMPTAGPGGDSEGRKQAVLAGPVKEASERGYCIYVVGFGEPSEGNIDQDFLNAIVQAAGCDDGFYTATEAVQLHAAYVEMRYNSMGWNLIRRLTDAVQQGEEKDVGEISIPPSQQALHATLVWPGSQLDLILEDPQGRPVNVGYPGATIDVYDNMVYTIVSDPLSGTWKASVYGRDIPLGSTKFAFLASVEPAEEPAPSQAIPERLIVTTYCPVDLAVKDPEGLVVNKQFSNVPETIYTEEDMNQDGDPDDQIIIPNRKVGDYQIRVIPEERAFPIDRYTLEVSDGFDTIVLADYVRVSDIPEEPYVVTSTAEGIAIAAKSEAELNVPTPAPTPTPSPKQGINLSMLIAIIAGAVALVAIGVGVFLFLRSRYYI